MNDFETWVKLNMCKLWGPLDLCKNMEARSIYNRAKRLRQNGASRLDVLDYLDECQNPNSRS